MSSNKCRVAKADGRRSGFAYILAMMLIVVMASMGYAVTVTTDLQARQAANTSDAFDAHASTESGLSYLVYVLSTCDLTSNVSGEALLDSLAISLQGKMNNTDNLGDRTVSYDGNSTITIPSVAFSDNSSFSAVITMPDSGTVRLSVTGSYTTGAGTTLSRSMSMDFDKGSKAGELDYGMFSAGPINIGMNCSYTGLTSDDEASMYTEAVVVGLAIEVDSGYISGNVDLKDSYGSVAISADVGGTINYGVTGRAIPTIDPSVFSPFAVTTIDSNTPTRNVTLINPRIAANTNPVFDNNVTIQGVLYIEAPNYVVFNNNATVTGVIVSEQPDSVDAQSTNKVYFKNNLTLNPIEDLPEEGFATLRAMTGSAILTPGFDIEFKNNFGTISGTVACESLTAKNNVDATISGSIILGDGGIHLENNATIRIDRSKYAAVPAGVIIPGPTILTADPDTYTETN